MTPQGILGDVEKALSRAEQTVGQQAQATASADVGNLLNAIHNRISNIENGVLTLTDAVQSKAARYGLAAAAALGGFILGKLI